MMLPNWFFRRRKARRHGQAPHLSLPPGRSTATGAGLARALACLVTFQPSAGLPAPTGHGEPPPVRLTTASWQQPV